MRAARADGLIATPVRPAGGREVLSKTDVARLSFEARLGRLRELTLPSREPSDEDLGFQPSVRISIVSFGRDRCCGTTPIRGGIELPGPFRRLATLRGTL